MTHFGRENAKAQCDFRVVEKAIKKLPYFAQNYGRFQINHDRRGFI